MSSNVQILAAWAPVSALTHHVTSSKVFNICCLVCKLGIKNEGGHFHREGICVIEEGNNPSLEAALSRTCGLVHDTVPSFSNNIIHFVSKLKPEAVT